jgi:hypothetical protein
MFAARNFKATAAAREYIGKELALTMLLVKAGLVDV